MYAQKMSTPSFLRKNFTIYENLKENLHNQKSLPLFCEINYKRCSDEREITV